VARRECASFDVREGEMRKFLFGLGVIAAGSCGVVLGDCDTRAWLTGTSSVSLGATPCGGQFCPDNRRWERTYECQNDGVHQRCEDDNSLWTTMYETYACVNIDGWSCVPTFLSLVFHGKKTVPC
jgi:hypothetical protein